MEDLKYLRFMGGRKFVLSLATLVSSSVLVWFGKIDPGVYSAVVIANIGAFIVGNVYQNTKVQ